jgi:flagellar hook-basal body complex protein FliE
MQMTSANTKANFEVSGDVDVTEVLMKSQKASVAFEATLQIRNKILKAYQDVMSMPV